MLITDPPVQVTANLMMLGTAEYPLYLVRGEREGAIFEGGTGPVGPLLQEQLGQLSIDPETIRQIIVPHAHPDHVMALPMLREIFPGAVVLASEAAAGTLSNEKAISFFCKVDGAITAALIESEIVSERHRPKPLVEMRMPVDRILSDGDTVAVDAMAFHVLKSPGHSDCSLSFHEPRQRILIASDAVPYLMPDGKSWWPCYFNGYADYVASMWKLQDLNAEILCLGHRAVVQGVEDVRTYFDDLIAATEQYHRRIIDEVKSGKAVRQLAEQLGSEAYEKTGWLPLDFFQKNCNLLIKQSLQHEGVA